MYVVCTRPLQQNRLGLTPAQPHQEITKVRSLFQLLPETAGVYNAWEGLAAKYAVAGKPAHDRRLAAFMVEHRLVQILTFNDQNFVRYAEIRTLNPFDVLGLPRT